MRGDLCQNTGINNYREIDGINYLVARCEPTAPSKRSYTKIDRNHPAVKELLAQKILPGEYKTKKIKGKVIVTRDKRTPVKKFLNALENACERLDMHCHGLLNVMYFETGGTFDPRKKKKSCRKCFWIDSVRK